MVRFLSPLLLLPAGCTIGSPPAAALTAPNPTATVRAQIEATYQTRMRAFEAEDFETLMAQVSPRFSAIRPDGTALTREDLAGYIRNNLQRWVRITRQSNAIESLRLDGDNAVVDVRQNLARIQIVDGREALVESSVLQTETRTPGRDGWQLLSVRNEREMRVTVDGRVVG